MIYWLLGRSRTVRVLAREFNGYAATDGYLRAGWALLALLVAGIPEPRPRCFCRQPGFYGDGCFTPHSPVYCNGCPNCPTTKSGDVAHTYR